MAKPNPLSSVRLLSALALIAGLAFSASTAPQPVRTLPFEPDLTMHEPAYDRGERACAAHVEWWRDQGTDWPEGPALCYVIDMLLGGHNTSVYLHSFHLERLGYRLLRQRRYQLTEGTFAVSHLWATADDEPRLYFHYQLKDEELLLTVVAVGDP